MKDQDVKIQINTIDVKGSVADGPGTRSVVYFQGCNRHCRGCHNLQTWDPRGGKEMTVGDVMQCLLSTHIHRVTLSGGEPLQQPTALRALLRCMKASGFDIALYTGGSKDEVPLDIVKSVKYLKTGAFDASQKTSLKPFVGSSNQMFEAVA